MGTNNLLILAGILAIIAEIAIGAASGFDLFVIGLACIIGGLIGIVFNSSLIAVSFISISLIAYIVIGRRLVKQKLHIKTITTNVDNLIGQTAVVVKEIQPNLPGQVKLEGEIWRAEAEMKIVQDQKCIVLSVSGVTLKVEPGKE